MTDAKADKALWAKKTKKEKAAYLALEKKDLEDDKTAWDTCAKDAVADGKKDHHKPVITVACQADLLTYLEAKAAYDHGEPKNTAVVGIIVGCCVGAVVLGGLTLWYCKHKKGKDQAEGSFSTDDDYAAYVDTELA